MISGPAMGRARPRPRSRRRSPRMPRFARPIAATGLRRASISGFATRAQSIANDLRAPVATSAAGWAASLHALSCAPRLLNSLPSNDDQAPSPALLPMEPNGVTQSLSLFARAAQLAAVLALLATPYALAQDLPPGHPPVPSAEAQAAPAGDAKPAEAKQADAQPASCQAIGLTSPGRLHHPSHHHHRRHAAELYGGSRHDCPPRAGSKPAAEIFYVAYTRDPLNTKRPITFVFNGGPGAAVGLSASWRHRPARHRGHRQRRAGRPPAPARRQSEHLARHDRPRLRRSGRHRL